MTSFQHCKFMALNSLTRKEEQTTTFYNFINHHRLNVAICFNKLNSTFTAPQIDCDCDRLSFFIASYCSELLVECPLRKSVSFVMDFSFYFIPTDLFENPKSNLSWEHFTVTTGQKQELHCVDSFKRCQGSRRRWLWLSI